MIANRIFYGKNGKILTQYDKTKGIGLNVITKKKIVRQFVMDINYYEDYLTG